ncbi:MAG: electron transport complex subunit RsxG [Mariprofundaceae bacterium]|nr:electron transport complex subunit RsxG [Mariprofundaceae bacterium]
MKFDKNQQQTALALFFVALFSASLLALVNNITKEPIAQAERQALHQALAQVLPQHHNDALEDVFLLPLADKSNQQVFPAKDKQGKTLAFAWQQIAPDGYSGTIKILMGVNIRGEVVAIRITKHLETPGLGDAITKNQQWLNSFSHKTTSNTRWAVKKDGGDFDQFTGATITPRAVVQAVHEGLLLFQQYQQSMLKLSQKIKTTG